MLGHGVKQIQTIRKDLSVFEKDYLQSPLSVQGQISVSISNLFRIIAEISSGVEKEPSEENKAKLEKKLSKLQNEADDLKSRFERIKKKKEESNFESSKSELLNRGARSVHRNNNDGLADIVASSSSSSSNPYGYQTGSGLGYQEGLEKELKTLGRASQQLDEILEMGQRSFDDIVTQNQYLRIFEQKLSSSLVTLGVSRSTIQRVERRVYKDRFIFFGGALFMFFCFYLILSYF